LQNAHVGQGPGDEHQNEQCDQEQRQYGLAVRQTPDQLVHRPAYPVWASAIAQCQEREISVKAASG
jgi:hypothetical protein